MHHFPMHHCRHITCAPLSVTAPAARVLRGSGGVTHHAAADTHHPYLLAASDVQDQVGQPPLAGPDPDAATATSDVEIEADLVHRGGLDFAIVHAVAAFAMPGVQHNPDTEAFAIAEKSKAVEPTKVTYCNTSQLLPPGQRL